MQAITVHPGIPNSARLDEIEEPARSEGPILVEAVALGVCGTDREILAGTYGSAPPGEERLVLGHESLGRVIEAPDGSGFHAGDLVVGIVRRPDPVPCAECAAGEWDMCSNGRYTEHGIKMLHGFGRERFRLQASHCVRVDGALGLRGVLLEPASVVAKAWDHIHRIGARAAWTPRRVLVLGAGPVGLLAALLGRLAGFEVHVLDRATGGPKPALVEQLQATYHRGAVTGVGTGIDIVIECTGSPSLVMDAIGTAAPNAIVCLTGVSSGRRMLRVDAAALNNGLVLENNVVFGSVNANRSHYAMAADALARADGRWLDGLLTRRVPLDGWPAAYERRAGDVKTIIDFEHVSR